MSSLGLEWRSNKQDKTGNNHKAPYTNSMYNYPRCSSVDVVDVSHFFLPRNSCTGGHPAACSPCVCRWSSANSWRPLQRQSCSSQSAETASTTAWPESVESSWWLSPAGTASQPGRTGLAWRESRQWLGHCPPASIRQSTSLVWTTAPTQELPLSLLRLLDQRTLS